VDQKIFNFGVNVSKCSQAFYTDYDNLPVNIAQDCAVDISDFRFLTKAIQPVPSVINYWKDRGIKRIFLRRTFAMGDILMLVPIVRYLRKLGFDPYIKTVNRYFSILRQLNIDYSPIGFGPDGGGIELDKTVERDHSHSKLQKYHRIQIYMLALGFDSFPETLDWRYNEKNFPKLEELKGFKFKKKDYIVFQGSGSTKAKTLPKVRIESLINTLNENGIKVVYIGNSITLNLDKPELTDMACVKYPFPQLFPLFKHAKAAVIMDSGPLWLSHFTETPIVVIFGPTSPETRLHYHPLFPKQVRAIETNNYINCSHCFEAAAKCNHRFDCLHIPIDTFFDDLYFKLREIWD